MSVIQFFLFGLWLISCDAQKKSYYIMTEHPAITYRNPVCLSYVNITSNRHGRRSPMYYVDIHFTNLVPLDNTLQVDFYFFEFLSNEYRRSFVEMHFKWCNLVHKDPFFGAAMNQGKLRRPCPHVPDEYHLYNMSIPSEVIPPGFPFVKGRIYANLTFKNPHMNFLCVTGYIDMELKEHRRLKSKAKV